MITSNLFYELIDLKSVLKDIELFKVTVDLNSKSIIQHQLVRIETNPELQGRIMISRYIANQLLALTPPVIYPGRVSELKWRLTDSFITTGQPRIIPAIVGNYHFKDDFIIDYFDGISDITVSVIPSISPSATRDKLLVGVTATLYVKKIETDSLESVDVGFINWKEVDVDENLNTIDYNICFNGLIEQHDQILRKKIMEKLIKFI